MKKYLVGVALVVCGAFMMHDPSFASPSAAVVQAQGSQPTVPGPKNPYCNKTASDFPLLDVDCPSDGYYVVDVACVAACDDAYRAKMLDIYNTACDVYDSANEDYKLCVRVAIHAYDACAATATTLPELEACRNTMISSISNCVDSLTTVRNGIASSVATATATAQAEFQACASLCCHKVGELGGKDNGGKIGDQGDRNGH